MNRINFHPKWFSIFYSFRFENFAMRGTILWFFIFLLQVYCSHCTNVLHVFAPVHFVLQRFTKLIFSFREILKRKVSLGVPPKNNSVKMCKFFPPIVPPESVFRTFLYLSKLSRRCQLTPIQFLFQDFGLGLLCCLPSRCWCWSGSRHSWRGTSGRSRPGSAPPFLTHGWPK